jgi:thioesterase domain-containing protein
MAKEDVFAHETFLLPQLQAHVTSIDQFQGALNRLILMITGPSWSAWNNGSITARQTGNRLDGNQASAVVSPANAQVLALIRELIRAQLE